ncbi:hypothetical protein [Streptomyces sp. NPDC005969]|uniref:hypothetical protein n=1 Tax=Streptomyces sp. NPDC005969 TaxID=3156722 RepID=UPI0033DB9153
MTEPRRTVARKADGVSMEALGADCRHIKAVFEEAGGDSVTARRTAVALGWDSSVPAWVEGTRGQAPAPHQPGERPLDDPTAR